MNDRLAQQVAIYGSPLSSRFAGLREYYGLSQRQLAEVLGISAPMLSQLSTGARIKFGNPRVFERLLLLEELGAQGAPREEALTQVREASNATDTARETARLRQAHPAEPVQPGTSPEALAASLAALLPAGEVSAALDRVQDLPRLSALLRAAREGQATAR